MKIILLLIASFIGITFVSCNNNKVSENNNIDQTRDSIHRADSIAEVHKAMDERKRYHAYIKHELDSMEKALVKLDSFYTDKKMKGKLEWKNEKAGIMAGIEKLKNSEKEAETQAQDGWKNFKMQTDTSIQNLKAFWNKAIDKLKVN